MFFAPENCLEIPMPESGMAVNFDEAKALADKIGYPIMMRQPCERRVK